MAETNPTKDEDAITEEEITGTTIQSPATTSSTTTKSPTRNAFSALMDPKRPRPSSSTYRKTSSTYRKPPSTTPKPSSLHNPPNPQPFTGRNALGAYIASPASFPPTRVISHSPTFVTIHDLYPKSSIHVLLLPRHPSKTHLHPFTALSDPSFLASVQSQVLSLRALVAKELRRRYGKFSAQDRARDAALEAWPPLPEASVPKGRDWERDVVSGVHAVPSMAHLHVHVLSVDRVSECVRHRKHYNSFNTPFFVGVEEFPLVEGGERREAGKRGYLREELRCWRCGEGFGNQFARLKEHLKEEFEEWVRE